jgi:predicted esterase
MNVIAVDYVGYGLSNGTPSEQGCYLAADMLMSYLMLKLNVNPANIIIVGRSLGSGPACYIAERLSKDRRNPRLLVLISPFTSVKALAIKNVGIIGHLIVDRFVNISRIQNYTGKLCLVHGKEDDVVPVSHSAALSYYYSQTSGNDPCVDIIEHCGHNDLPTQEVVHTIRKFIAKER